MKVSELKENVINLNAVKVGDIILDTSGQERIVFYVKPKESGDDPYGPYVGVHHPDNEKHQSHYRIGLKLEMSGERLVLVDQREDQNVWEFKKTKELTPDEQERISKMTGGLI